MKPNLNPSQTALVNNVRDLVRSGYGALVTFEAADAPWLEIAGPTSFDAGGHPFGAPVPTVRLRRSSDATLLAEAAANNDFLKGLTTLGQCAKPLVGDEYPALVALLGAIHDASGAKRRRVPTVGDAISEVGVPNVHGWMSCLTLGDLQAAVAKATIIRQAA